MSTLAPEEVLFTRPAGKDLSQSVETIETENGIFTNATITNLNGTALVGALVTTGATQTLTNKSLDDSTTYFVNTSDSTKKVAISASGSAGTTSTLIFSQTTNRNYTVPDSGASCEIVTTEGDQIINGNKSFSNISLSSPFTLDNKVTYANGTTTTTNAVTSTLYTIAATASTSYIFNASVICTDSSGNSGAFNVSFKTAFNGAGTAINTSIFGTVSTADTSVSSASVTYTTSGSNVLVRVTGVAGLTLKWAGYVSYTSTPF